MNEPRVDDLFVALIVEDATGKVEWQSEPTTERMADRMAAGAGTNLNWDRFHTEVRRAGKRNAVAANVGYMLPSKVTPILRTNAEIRNEARRRVREAGR